MTKDFDTIFNLIKELDSDQANWDVKMSDTYGTFEKLKKTTAVLDQAIEDSFLKRFGIEGVSFSNLEQVYSPAISGMGSMAQVRTHLLMNGMTQQFADMLASRYIKKAEEGTIFAIMDLFDTRKPQNK